MPFSNAISTVRTPYRKNPWLIALSIGFLILWVVTFLGTTDRTNWVLENLLVVAGVAFLIWSYPRMQLSDLSYLLITIYLSLHVYGSMYTYAENPLGWWLAEQFGSTRNHYDRIVHFSFGFLLAYPMREVFLVAFRWPPWVAWFLPIEITLSFSALYELMEWAVADLFFRDQGAAFLGTQGDVWDAQKDIALAFTGAVLATTLVSVIKRRFRIE